MVDRHAGKSAWTRRGASRKRQASVANGRRLAGRCAAAHFRAAGDTLTPSTAQRATVFVATWRISVAAGTLGVACPLKGFDVDQTSTMMGDCTPFASAAACLRRLAGLGFRPRFCFFLRLAGNLAAWPSGKQLRRSTPTNRSCRRCEQGRDQQYRRDKRGARQGSSRLTASSERNRSCEHVALVGETVNSA
jgi:hypothetical protein